MSGRGTVFSHSHVHVAFQGGAWSGQLPYTVVLVDLAEGPRMLSRLIGADAPAVRGGDAVSVVFPQIGDRRYPFFERVPAG
ncbi:OB-fold domain-containing protein [Azospirillum sp. B21]|nr:OB-fold domain-containing protein [Azospirillum sp. B21]